MVSDKQIRKWLDEGLINKKQSEKMLSDIAKSKQESKSKKLIVTFSTIGALLLGIGAVLFVGSNWQLMPNLIKFIVLLLATGFTYYLGYFLKFQNKNYPYVGSALIFLGALLFGATVILTAQMYNWSANSHWLVLIWILGVVPLVYLYNSKPIAALFAVLIFVWIGLLVFRNMSFFSGFGMREIIPLYFASGALMMTFGAYHYIHNKFVSIARIYRLLGIKVMMTTLFLLTFEGIVRMSSYGMERFADYNSQLIVGFVILSVLAIISMFINLFFNPAKIPTSKYENGFGLGLIALIMIFYFVPTITVIYAVIFNLIFAGLIILLLYLGNMKEDMALINTGIVWLGIFLIVKYFDFFFGMMPTSLFMLVGGLILVSGSIALEKKRRKIKKDFGENK